MGAQQSTLQGPFIAPHLHELPSPGGEADREQANPNIKQTQIWIRAMNGQKEKPEVEESRRERVEGGVDTGGGPL